MSHTNPPIWTPTQQQIDTASLTRFMAFIAKDGHKLSHYHDLYAFSVRLPHLFWKYLWEYGSFTEHTPYRSVLSHADKMLEATWFEGLTFNFAENLLKFRDERVAITAYDERGKRSSITYYELYEKVAKVSHWMKACGIQQGDRVAAFMPNIPETIIAMLAATSLGATWSSCSPDFGIQGVLDRFGQIKPKLLITTDGYFYNGKVQNSVEKLKSILPELTEIEHVLVVPYVHANESVSNDALGSLPSLTVSQWQQALDNTAQDISFTPTPFDHPLYILYSSGTTGAPKCIVHGAGGTLIQHYKELVMHTNVTANDTLFYYTTCGWMMWNWMVSTLMTGATLVIYDGSPFYPGPNVLWDMAENENITVFGTSAKYISALEKANYQPKEHHNLSALNALLSTGSPLSKESFDFVYSTIKQNLCLSSIAGGTDIVSCFTLGNPTLPVYRGELQCLGLGMAVNVFDDAGQPIEPNSKQRGELVCTVPFPSMPVGFFNDPNQERYKKSYFARFDNVWAHGDFAELISHEDHGKEYQSLIIHGRSDAVLNPGGVRIGTAEIYRQVEKLDDVVESIAIGQEWPKGGDDVRVVLFVVLRDNIHLSEALQQDIKDVIRANTTPRHVPAVIVQVEDIPRTLSGKIVEIAVRDTVHNRPVKNTDALKNPEALNHFKNRLELAYPAD